MLGAEDKSVNKTKTLRAFVELYVKWEIFHF